MHSTTYLPSYTIGTDAYDNIANICCAYGKTAVVIGGKTAISKAKDELLSASNNSDLQISDFLWFGGNATHKNINNLLANSAVKTADMIFAVGGGRAVDTAKAVADKLEKPVFTFPTIASNCAPVTSLCILYNEDGSFGEFYMGKRPAIHSFINTSIIVKAPIMYFRAGIGDALSKQYEAEFNARKDELNHSNELGLQISRNCSRQLLKYGIAALADAKTQTSSMAFAETAATIIVNTGLVSVLVDNCYNSSLAHAAYISRTQLADCESHMHGEIVDYGVLFLLTLDGQLDERNKVYSFNKKAGLPVCLNDIGVHNNDLDKFIQVISEDKYINYAPYTVDKAKIKSAIDALEKYHQSQL